jgi:hypothetical protein
MAVSGQFHAPAALTLGKSRTIPIRDVLNNGMEQLDAELWFNL